MKIQSVVNPYNISDRRIKASERVSLYSSGDKISFRGYQDKTISELALDIEKEIDEAKKSRLDINTDSLYERDLKSSFFHVTENYGQKRVHKIVGDKFVRKGELEFKRCYYVKAYDIYKALQKGIFKKKELSALSRDVDSYASRSVEKDFYVSRILPTLKRDESIRIAINHDIEQGKLNAAKSDLLKWFLYELQGYVYNSQSLRNLSANTNSTNFANDRQNVTQSAKSGKKNAEDKKLNEKVKEDKKNSSRVTSYASQYESAVQAERDFMSRVKDSSNLTEKEQQSHWELSHKIGEIKNEAKANHASIVIRRSESDFPEDKALNASEKSRYIQKDVLWRMNTNKESALDGLDMFEQYGQKESYKTSNTMYELSRRITSLPVSDRSDKVLSRYLDIMEKIGEKDSKYEDCYELASAMRIYIDENSGDLSNTTVLRGIKLVKELSTRRQPGENVCEGLRKCSGEKDVLRDDPAIQSAAEDLRNYIKDMPY